MYGGHITYNLFFVCVCWELNPDLIMTFQTYT